MAFDQSAGLWIAVAVSVSALVVSAVVGSRWSEFTLAQAVGVAAAVFAASFSVLNLAMQVGQFNRGLWRAEVASGRLGLRITSLTVLVAYAHVLHALIKDHSRTVPIFSGFAHQADAFVRAGKGWPLTTVASQATTFMIALAGSWSFTIAGRASAVIALLNWSFAFICDDFFLAAAYRRKKEVAPPIFERFKLFILSFAIVVLLAIASIQEFSVWIGLIVSLLGLIYLIVLPVARWYSEEGGVFLETIGVYTDDWGEETMDDLRAAVAAGQLCNRERDRLVGDAHSHSISKDELSKVTGLSHEQVALLIAEYKDRLVRGTHDASGE